MIFKTTTMLNFLKHIHKAEANSSNFKSKLNPIENKDKKLNLTLT